MLRCLTQAIRLPSLQWSRRRNSTYFEVTCFKERIEMTNFGLFWAVFMFLLLPRFAVARSLADYVNPLVGTAADGQTFPGTGMPFGMTQWTPATQDAETKGVAPYYFAD